MYEISCKNFSDTFQSKSRKDVKYRKQALWNSFSLDENLTVSNNKKRHLVKAI